MAEIELRISESDIVASDWLFFQEWIKTCMSRLENFRYTNDVITLEYIFKLAGNSSDICYCLEMLGLKGDKKQKYLEEIQNG